MAQQNKIPLNETYAQGHRGLRTPLKKNSRGIPKINLQSSQIYCTFVR